MASIQLCGVSKVYRGVVSRNDSKWSGRESLDFRAVDHIDLDVKNGELLVLMGPSGSGKTTLLRLIAGLDEPSEGTIRIENRVQDGVPSNTRNTAMVFQGLGLYGHLTVRENIEFGLQRPRQFQAVSRWMVGEKDNQGEVEQSVRSIAQGLGIESLLDKRPAELSGGEQQRVAIGRALVRRPKVFLLDEPLASLDGPTRGILRQTIKRLQRESGTTTIYVTHDQAEALALGDRIGVLHNGRLQQVGTPQDVYDQPMNRQVASLFGSQGMCFISGVIEKSSDGAEWKSGEWTLPVPVNVAHGVVGRERMEVVVGVRPDDVVVDSNAPQSIGTRYWTGITESVEYQGGVSYVEVVQRGGVVGECRPVVRALIAGPPPNRGDAVAIQFQAQKIYWFDGVSGANLGLNALPGPK
jgi:multiple sugar transport system ATP-binding protein